MRTAQELGAEYDDQLGRCEGCGRFVSESTLTELNTASGGETAFCVDCVCDLVDVSPQFTVIVK